ncbi:MAG: RND transporter [Burkholderiales bacterium RIFCSPLOWO2_02_FULL_57_36]|nr:MAG: RND transporter [Burkholderiales bacterium RIFCSPLOWO2_02_FULL_57_36]
MKAFVSQLEDFLFHRRAAVFAVLLALTAVMGYFALQLKMEAGFEKQMPVGHEYTNTFMQYREQLFGANRLTIVVRARKGTIWTEQGLTRLYDLTQAVVHLPNVDRLGVQSLWTPNSFVNEITEEGFRAQPIIDATITARTLTPDAIANARRATSQGGYVGSLVSRDHTSAMITADIAEVDAQGNKLDYVAFNRLMEKNLRQKFEDKDFEIQIIGFAKQIGDIGEGASTVLEFCSLAILLTLFAVYWFCRSWRLTLLAVLCSFTSLIWQFGTLRLIGYGLDPLAVLVPFLVFAIGVSHGVQQINFIVRRLAQGRTAMQAARDSFSGLLIPGALALIVALVTFGTLMLIPIPMIQELAVTASIGVGYKIITNLVMLPLAVSYCSFKPSFAEQAMQRRERRTRLVKTIAVVARPRNAVAITCLSLAVLGVSIWQSSDRIVGTLQPGAPELRAESRFNRDAVSIAGAYDIGLDWLTLVFESPKDACGNVAVGKYQDDFVWRMTQVPGVQTIRSFSGELRIYNQGYNEGNPKMAVTPIDSRNYAGLAAEIGRNRGYVNSDCSMTAVHLFLTDHKATTINRVVDAAIQYRTLNPHPAVTIRLASGNAGVQAAINDELEASEIPMLLYVYAAIVLLVLLVYRDFRAAIACCLPLTIGTFIGYWFMKEFEIGLTVATLPVMVLAVGIGVDYALYIYNRLQMHMADGDPIFTAMERALEFEGMATIFTALTLAIGVGIWSFSALKFQADMGMLLAFMFIVNLVMTFTALPALAVVLERLFPRSKPAYAPSILTH